jgi:hypothetical protein
MLLKTFESQDLENEASQNEKGIEIDALQDQEQKGAKAAGSSLD